MNAQRIANKHHATFEGARQRTGCAVEDHFGGVTEMVGIGSGDAEGWL
jgi:hypothetical protein